MSNLFLIFKLKPKFLLSIFVKIKLNKVEKSLDFIGLFSIFKT